MHYAVLQVKRMLSLCEHGVCYGMLGLLLADI
jgi:hypothetical protein